MSSHEVLTGSFDSLLARPDAHVVLDLATESPTLLVLFGGIAGGVSMPVFEFFRLTSGFPAKKVFLRDPRRGWYQLGIPGVGESPADVRDLLARDPHARAPRGAPQPPVDALQLARLVKRSRLERLLELGAQRQQMPAQPVLHARALGDEIAAVIRE